MTQRDDEELPMDNPVVVRTLREEDLPAIVDIDASLMGRPRREYFRDKVHSALRDSRIHLSFVAELDGRLAGFLMSRLHYGEFGQAEPVVVLDSIGVHRDFRHRQVGRTLMIEFLRHARILHIDRVRTEVAWNELELLRFLDRFGFGPSSRLVLERPL